MGLKPRSARGKWFKVNDLNNLVIYALQCNASIQQRKDTDLWANHVIYTRQVLTCQFIIMPPFKEVGVYCFANVGSLVGQLVGQSVDKPCDRFITKELIAQGSSNLVWWLTMISRWPLLNLGFLDQRSRSLWDLSLGGHTCFTNISYFKKLHARVISQIGKFQQIQCIDTIFPFCHLKLGKRINNDCGQYLHNERGSNENSLRRKILSLWLISS